MFVCASFKWSPFLKGVHLIRHCPNSFLTPTPAHPLPTVKGAPLRFGSIDLRHFRRPVNRPRITFGKLDCKWNPTSTGCISEKKKKICFLDSEYFAHMFSCPVDKYGENNFLRCEFFAQMCPQYRWLHIWAIIGNAHNAFFCTQVSIPTDVLELFFSAFHRNWNFMEVLQPLKSSTLDQQLPSNLLKTDFPFKMTVHKCKRKKQCHCYEFRVFPTNLFFLQNEIILRGKKHTTLFQTYCWEKSSFFNALIHTCICRDIRKYVAGVLIGLKVFFSFVIIFSCKNSLLFCFFCYLYIEICWCCYLYM